MSHEITAVRKNGRFALWREWDEEQDRYFYSVTWGPIGTTETPPAPYEGFCTGDYSRENMLFNRFVYADAKAIEQGCEGIAI